MALTRALTIDFEFEREQVLQELREWVQSGEDVDEPFLGFAGSDRTLSPRQILEEVETRSPLGVDFVKHWSELSHST